MPPTNGTGFFVVPFVFNGEHAGVGFWEYSSLCSKWLNICSEFLDENGECCNVCWRKSLSHIRTRMTSLCGTSIVTFSVHERLVCSALLMSGNSPVVDDQVARMWVDSLHQVDLVKVTALSPLPFETVLHLKERPLIATVSWGDENVSEDDHELIRELELHLAGAFFARQDNQ